MKEMTGTVGGGDFFRVWRNQVEGLRSEGKIMGHKEARTEEGRAGGPSEVRGRERGPMH